MLKPICDDCSLRLGRPTPLERVAGRCEIIPLLPDKPMPQRQRLYDRSSGSVHLFPHEKPVRDWYGIHCSMCSQRVDSRAGDDIISVYETTFAEYFGLPDPQDAPKNLRGKARRAVQKRLMELYGGPLFRMSQEAEDWTKFNAGPHRAAGRRWNMAHPPTCSRSAQLVKSRKQTSRLRTSRLAWTCSSGRPRQKVMTGRFGSAMA